MRRRLYRLLAFALIALAVVAARVVWSSRVEYREAESLRAAGDALYAVDHYGRAARLYAPGNPFSARSLDRLQEIAERAEAGGDRGLALAAWREVRASVLATRAVYSPNANRRAIADQHIAALMAAVETAPGAPPETAKSNLRWHAERLARDDAPSVLWSLLALLGLAAWIGAAVAFIYRGLDDEDHLRRGPALACAAGVAAGMALFLVALARA